MIPILGKTINYRDYTKADIYAHCVLWHGLPGHASMGFQSADQAVCDDHAALMKARGIAGVNADYRGPDSAMSLAALRMLNSCEREGLGYFLCIDQIVGKLTQDAAIAEYVRVLNFALETFCSSPAYLRVGGLPVVSFFDTPPVDLKKVRSGLTQKMAFVLQGSFANPDADGAFGWVNPVPDARQINTSALQSFLKAAAANPSKVAFYPTYPGFDDAMASWGKGRYMSRRLGQTTLDTLALIPADAKYAILATWDDFEESTATLYSQG